MVVDIIGAGIGGLTLALTLEQNGIETRVFEQSKSISNVGAGIILASNAMQVYEKLGLKQEIESKGNIISGMNITQSNLKIISSVDLSHFERIHKVSNIAIHRAALHQILIEKLKSTIILNHKLSSFQKNKSDYSLQFENGKIYPSKVLIGADGIRSKVRDIIFPNCKIRNAKQICWRGISNDNIPSKYSNSLNEAWGKSDRFGFVKLSEDETYWYALKSFKKNSSEFSVSDLGDYFLDYALVVKGLIESTSISSIHTAEIEDINPVSGWFSDNVCLIGDAAHPATPNMGQGACQAIEDGYVLGRCLSKYELTKAFTEFQKIRMPKAKQVVKTSWMIGKVSHISNPLLIAARNRMMKWMPKNLSRKQLTQLFKISSI